jgi:hypothetical protein
VAYRVAGTEFLEDQDYWSAANSFARSAAFHNASEDEAHYLEMMYKAGDTYILMSEAARNGTARIQALYRASTTFHELDPGRFQESLDLLETAVQAARDEAVITGDPGVFDVLDLYYLPLFTQLAVDDVAAAEKMVEIGDLAMEMDYYPFAGSYYSSAAVFYSAADRSPEARTSLSLAADAYEEEIRAQDHWNYTAFLALREYLGQSLYIARYLGDDGRVADLEGLATSGIGPLGNELRAAAESLSAAGEYEDAASNYSAAAEAFYVLGDEETFKELNGLSGWITSILAKRAEDAGNLNLAAALYEEAGFLLQLAGNETHGQPYSSAASLYGRSGNELVVASNLSFAASDLYRAARNYEIAGDQDSANRHYETYVSVLRNLMESDPQSAGIILLSIADAQAAMGQTDLARESYAQSSDELIQILSAYLQQSPDYIAQIPSLPKSLVKAYRLSGRLFLARNIVQTLDYPYMYSTLATISSFAQMYKTAAGVHQSLAADDISIYDFESYAVNQLFAGISFLIAGDLSQAQASLELFESVSHPLHSFNRKFHQLLVESMNWKVSGSDDDLESALSILGEIQAASGSSDMTLLLEDLETFLGAGGDPEELASRAGATAEAGDWEEAGDLELAAGTLWYFREEYGRSLTSFEDSSYFYIKSGAHLDARSAATWAIEATTQPNDFSLGLHSLSQALIDSNRTLAGAAEASFREALREDYKPEKSRELAKVASKLKGIQWTPIALRASIGAVVILGFLSVFVIIRKRARK